MFRSSRRFEAAIEENRRGKSARKIGEENRNVCPVSALSPASRQKTEKRMTKLRLLGAAALILSSALASPVMAQEVIYSPGYCAQFYPNANCQNKGPGNPYTGDYQRRTAYQNSYRRNGDANIGTAGAIATAPFRGDSYAYDNRYRGGYGQYGYNNSYAARNGFVCQPGTWFKGEDGRRHLCQ